MDKTIRLWEISSGKLLRTLTGHANGVENVAWSLDGRMLASSSMDSTIGLWNTSIWLQIHTLEGPSKVRDWTVKSISFSCDGRLLASKIDDGTVRLWCTDTWQIGAVLEEPTSSKWAPGLVFHPKALILATLGEKDTVIRIWDLDMATLLGTAPVALSGHSQMVNRSHLSASHGNEENEPDLIKKLNELREVNKAPESHGNEENEPVLECVTDPDLIEKLNKLRVFRKAAGELRPLGFTLQYTLQGHTSQINHIAWSPDGRMLASPSGDNTIPPGMRRQASCCAPLLAIPVGPSL
jgi:WD40 repeat protein